MENTQNKYQRGKIYKIISNQTNLVYYGSTIEEVLTNRLSGHRQQYKSWLNGKHDYVTSFEIVKYQDCKIILVESYPCKTVYELTAREQYYIDNNTCVNKNKANTGLNRKDYIKQYQIEHMDELKAKKKEYYNNHIDEITQYKKEYYKKHEEETKEREKQYRQDHAEEIKEYKKQYQKVMLI